MRTASVQQMAEQVEVLPDATVGTLRWVYDEIEAVVSELSVIYFEPSTSTDDLVGDIAAMLDEARALLPS